MKFTVSSSLLLSRLQMVGKVISSKNTMAILDNFFTPSKWQYAYNHCN